MKSKKKSKKSFLSLHKKYYIFAAVFLIIMAFFLTWFLEYRYFANDALQAWEFFANRPKVFWYSAALMLLVLVLLTGITRRPVVAAGGMWALLIVLTFVHIEKFAMRGAPLLPEDLALASEAATLTQFIDKTGLFHMIIAVVLVLFATFVINRFVNHKFELKEYRSKSHRWWKRWALPSRIILVTISALLLINMTDFVRNHEGKRVEHVAWLDSDFVAWNQNINYDWNGFILGFLYNLQKYNLVPPDGYDEEKMAEIIEKYRLKAEVGNTDRIDVAEEGISIVIVLNESFTDPEIEYEGYKLTDYVPFWGGEIVPTWRSIQEKYPNGYMYSTDYGGGTANIEFEALTGMTNYWINTVPYTDLIPRGGDIPSVARYLKSKGYRTTAIHPYNGEMYKRNIVYKNLAYDTFFTHYNMNYGDREGNGGYLNDRAAYMETYDVLHEDDQNQFVTLITMQNHAPYNPTLYDETYFTITDTDINEGRRREIEIYYQLLHNSDKHLGDFLERLDESDKKVAVLFFGDHSAGLFDMVVNHDIKEVRDLARITPYFVYTNFETEHDELDLPMTTPNCLSNTLFNVLAAQKPEFYYLLDAVCEEEPILAHSWFNGGEAFRSTVLSEYELVTYDILGGKQYWLKPGL